MLFGQNSLTSQLVNLGIIEKALGFCYLPPARNAQCSAPNVFNTSRLVLGHGPMPKQVAAAGGLTSMQSAPLINVMYPNNPGATEPRVPEFRTLTTSTSVARFGEDSAHVLDTSASNVLW